MATVTVRIDDEDKKMLQLYAEKYEMTLSQLIRKVLKNFMKTHTKKK